MDSSGQQKRLGPNQLHVDLQPTFCVWKIPPFTRGEKELSRMEVDKSHNLSRVRIHVERVIGILKQKYTILESHNFMERLEGEITQSYRPYCYCV